MNQRDAEQQNRLNAAPGNLCPLPVPVIPDIHLIKPIGCGAFGEVWLGEESLLPGVFRAVKIIRAKPSRPSTRIEALSPGSDAASANRAVRELSGLQASQNRAAHHPHLVEVLRVGTLGDGNGAESSIYYVMEAADHVGGPQPCRPSDYRPLSLDAMLLAQGRLSPATAADYACQLLRALEHLHANQVHHHDVKPSNLLFVRGQLKLADLGLADEQAGAAGGTRAYCPPETNRPDDLYATGVVLYEMLTGLSASRFPEWPAVLLAEPAPLVRELRQLISRACDRDASRRFTSAREFADEVQSAVAPKPTPRTSRRAWLWGAGALAPAWLGSVYAARQWPVRRNEPENSRFGLPPFDGSQQELLSEPRPDGSVVHLTRKVGNETVRTAWFDHIGSIELFDLQVCFESPSMLCVAGGFRIVLVNNPVALSVSNYDPRETGYVMQLWLVLLGPDGKPTHDVDGIELLYHGQPEANPGTHGRFFDHVPLPAEFSGPLRLVIASTQAVNFQKAIEDRSMAALLEPEHFQDIAVIVKR